MIQWSRLRKKGPASLKILALEKESSGITPDQFSPYLKEEALQVWRLYRAEVIREIYFNALKHTAVLVLECTGADQAREILAALPLVRAGLIYFELIPLSPYDGFERLIKE